MFRRKEWFVSGGKLEKNSAKSITDKLLEIRGIKSEEAKREFLNPLEITLMHPNAFCDMPKAVERIVKAIDNKENILIYGDFDADGVTSTSLLVKTFRYLGANVSYYIPDRDKEGHGLNSDTLNKILNSDDTSNLKDLVKALSQNKPKLIITVDNGISSAKEVNFINSFGCDVIITDHHEPPEEVPPALAIINPKAMNALDERLTPLQIEYLTSLAGVGVAFKIAQGVLEKYDKMSYSYEILPFVAVGTIADLVPLIGENRYFVTKGLELIAQGKHFGLTELLKNAKVNTDNGLTAEQVAFSIAPRINASGRLESVEPAVKLLISDNKNEIKICIEQLERMNKFRQQMVTDLFNEADEELQKSKNRDNAIVLANPDWHIGIIGIAASKFVEKYYKPTFIMTYSEETKTYRCSARGVKELNIYDIITNISDKLEGFGGHKLAGGFTFSAEKTSFEEVKKALNKTVDEMLNGQKLNPSLNIDLEISPEDVDISLIEQISKLEPFGMSNPSPTFVINNLTLKEKKLMGSSNEHLKLIFEWENGTFDCIWWSKGDIPLLKGDRADIAFAPQLNVFNGATSVQLILKDIHSEALEKEDENKQKIYDHRKKVGILPQVNDYIKNTDKKVAVFVENRNITEKLKPYKNIFDSIINRINAHKSDVLMFFDYPADSDVLDTIIQTAAADSVHYMSYTSEKGQEESILKTFSGMIRYTCNNLDGVFDLTRGASALGITNAATETLLEIFEDAGMIKINERSEKSFRKKKKKTIELTQAIHTAKYKDFAEQIKTINSYKNSFMTADI